MFIEMAFKAGVMSDRIGSGVEWEINISYKIVNKGNNAVLNKNK